MEVDELYLVQRARVAADEILEHCFCFPTRKAMDLKDPKGFDQAVASLAAELGSRVADSDAAAVRAAMQVLNVDWRATTAAQRRSLITRALEAAGRRTAAVPGTIQAVFGRAATEVVQATRDEARRGHRLAIAADLNALDRRVIDYVSHSQTGFVRDEYGRRHELFTRRAREVVAHGIKSGLGRAEIARDLETAAHAMIGGQGSFYWEVVAGSLVSEGRSFAQLSSFAEAGIQRYVIEAVLDEHTTEICRYLHGKTFEVGDALRRFGQLEGLTEPDEIKAFHPWVRESIDPETGRTVLHVNRGSEQVRVAEVTRSAMGTRDERGEFSRGLSERELMDLGVSFPPYHGLCRSTCLPIV